MKSRNIFRSKFTGIILISFGVFLVLTSSILYLSLMSEMSKNSNVARVELYLEEEKRIFEGETIENMTVLDAMYAASIAGNITFKYTLDPEKNVTKVSALDGITYRSNSNSPDFYLNSEKIETEIIHAVTIKPGDVIVVKAD